MANGGLQWSWPGHRRRAVLAGFLLVASSTVALTTGPATEGIEEQVMPSNSTTGLALVEIYEAP